MFFIILKMTIKRNRNNRRVMNKLINVPFMAINYPAFSNNITTNKVVHFNRNLRKRLYKNQKRFYRTSNICLMKQFKTYKSLSERLWDLIPKIRFRPIRRNYYVSKPDHSEINKVDNFELKKVVPIKKEDNLYVEDSLQHFQVLEEKEVIENGVIYIEVHGVQITKTGGYFLPDKTFVGTFQVKKGLNIGKVGMKLKIKKEEYVNLKKDKTLNYTEEDKKLIIDLLNQKKGEISYWDINLGKVVNSDILYTPINDILKNIIKD